MITARPVEEKDLEQLMHWRMLPEITKYMYTDPVLTLETQKKWFEDSKKDDENIHFIVEIDHEPVGVLNITDIDRKNQKCSWGYYVAVNEKRSLKLALALEWNIYDYVFDVLKLHKLEGEIFAFNKAVIRIHQMCGSRIEGTRKDAICKNGEFYDIVETGICKEEWQEEKKKHDYEKIMFL